ncbi:coproporphyrinogen dehydrogenase HemZ [Thermosyntropha sp.]|uniref:coproporphyrinogen dehydrogenase HemZ n=1 Tax=Thermosyntropha sp. TaxID=2740820 RepID=UPI0025FEFE89|nr:coproporphyrinogen dehydrogenase HemZ [Thermosyntropha sp.]MBO8159303.1 coproporphyrinogen dehydrogenase HemZ [Thermosyntropha sp.]
MLIYMNLTPVVLYDYVHELVRMGYPGAEITLEPSLDVETVITVSAHKEDNVLVFAGEIRQEEKTTDLSYLYNLPDENEQNEMHKAARIFIFKLLHKHLGKRVNTYGILTGVRPVKLVHRFLDKGYLPDAIKEILKEEYLLQEDKAELLTEVACNNRSYLLNKDEAHKLVSIYIGIPFCPSRCYYCSFPGAVLRSYEDEIPPFLKALTFEIEAISAFLNRKQVKVQTIYIGGGTPTVLSEKDTEYLFRLIKDNFISVCTSEITVEAGRPDTLTYSKLKILKEAGVNRVCINPQSMHDATLRAIGRNHDVKGVVEAFEWARKAGIENINMDIIVGLPGEGLKENAHTAERILLLQPENVTVHTLAVKRGAKMAEKEGKTVSKNQIEKVQKGVKYFSDVLNEAGYIPYYLYRQKYMQASMENTGFSKNDRFCLYNIQMIEERQTIIGLGGGAASKFVNSEDWTLSSLYNPKNPEVYCETVYNLVNRKVDKLKCLN